jgi:hypothetical protein
MRPRESTLAAPRASIPAADFGAASPQSWPAASCPSPGGSRFVLQPSHHPHDPSSYYGSCSAALSRSIQPTRDRQYQQGWDEGQQYRNRGWDIPSLLLADHQHMEDDNDCVYRLGNACPPYDNYDALLNNACPATFGKSSRILAATNNDPLTAAALSTHGVPNNKNDAISPVV